MAYCTTCLDGPEDRSGIVMEWGDSDSKSFVVSGQAWGEENLIGRPAILDMPVGKGHDACSTMRSRSKVKFMPDPFGHVDEGALCPDGTAAPRAVVGSRAAD